MCYNYETSRNTFIIGTLGTVINLIKFRKNPFLVTLNIMWYFGISMQFWEALIWKNYKCNFSSKAAMINNLIQPLSVLLFLLIPNYKVKNMNLIISITLIYLTYVFRYFSIDYGCIKDSFGVNLAWWDSVGGRMHFFTFLILFKLILPPYMFKSQSFLFITSWIIGFILSNNNSKHIASLWCWVAAFIPYFNYFIFSK